MASATTFDWTSTYNGNVYTGTGVAVQPYWLGNAVLGNGVVLRFFASTGHALGTQWSFSVTAAGVVTINTQPLSKLRVVVQGTTVTGRYTVRIKSSRTGVGGVDQYEYSANGGAFVGPIDVLPPTDAVGNAELGNGIRIFFGAAYGYAPGQTWEIATLASTVSVTASPSQREFAPCSNRGICNSDTGSCSCFDGFTGADWYVAPRTARMPRASRAL
jgi:hypothetical protein